MNKLSLGLCVLMAGARCLGAPGYLKIGDAVFVRAYAPPETRRRAIRRAG
jgi:hypothetical protein